MNEFERMLGECLEALREGVDIEACLSRYPLHADQLRPHLVAAAAVTRAFDLRPSEEFATSARERFLIASGRRIQEGFDIEPSPSFFATARVRFLMTAQRMGLAERARGTQRRVLPGTRFGALATAGMALVVFLGASTYTVASANSALPGDWQYGVKLQTERVRLTFALSEDAERDVRIDIAEERVKEIQAMAARGRIIGPGVLERLHEQTKPLAQAVNEDDLNIEDLERVQAVTEKTRDVLEQAAPQVAPEAQQQLDAVSALAVSTAKKAAVQIVNIDPRPVLTPDDPLKTPEPEETETPEPTATADPSGAPGADQTPEAEPTPAREGLDPGLQVDPTPAGLLYGVTWMRLAVGRLTTLIPSQQDGWQIQGINVANGPVPEPALIRLSNADGTQFITLNPRNGDTWWFIAVNGTFDEIRLRETRDGQAYVMDRGLLQTLYGSFVDVPLFIMDNIELLPEPEPEPSPEPTVTEPAP